MVTSLRYTKERGAALTGKQTYRLYRWVNSVTFYNKKQPFQFFSASLISYIYDINCQAKRNIFYIKVEVLVRTLIFNHSYNKLNAYYVYKSLIRLLRNFYFFFLENIANACDDKTRLKNYVFILPPIILYNTYYNTY